MYPTLNEIFKVIKKQPLYSAFIGYQGKNVGGNQVE